MTIKESRFGIRFLGLLLLVGFSQVLIGQNTPIILPKPALLEMKVGYFVLSKSPVIAVAGTDPSVRQLAEEFARQIGNIGGLDTKVFAGNFRVKYGINFVFSKDPKLGKEGYFLDISPQRVVITAERYDGFVKGLSALKQLLPPEIFGTKRVENVKWQARCCYVEDQD